MDTSHHTHINLRTRRLLRAVSVLALVAVSFALVGGLTGHGPDPGPGPGAAQANAASFTLAPRSVLRSAGHDAPPPPRFGMGPRLRAAGSISDDSNASTKSALVGGTAPSSDASVTGTPVAEASSVFVLFSSSASRTRGQPVLG